MPLMAPANEAPTGRPMTPSFHFVGWLHAPAYAAAAANLLDDCNVVAIEVVGLDSTSDRQRFNALATAFVSTASSRDKRAAERFFNNRPAESTSIFRALQGSDKRIVTVDVNNGPGLARMHATYRMEEDILRTVHRTSSTAIKDHYARMGRLLAPMNAHREALVTSQLYTLAAEYIGTSAHIGVLTGANHTAPYHALSKTFPTRRSFARKWLAGQTPADQWYFTPNMQIMRHCRFFPDKLIPAGIADRAVLHAVQIAALRAGVAASGNSRTRYAENLSDATASELVTILDGMKTGVLARIRRTRTLARMDAFLESAIVRS